MATPPTQKCHLIFNTNYLAILPSSTHHQRIYKLTKTHFRSPQMWFNTSKSIYNIYITQLYIELVCNIDHIAIQWYPEQSWILSTCFWFNPPWTSDAWMRQEHWMLIGSVNDLSPFASGHYLKDADSMSAGPLDNTSSAIWIKIQ